MDYIKYRIASLDVRNFACSKESPVGEISISTSFDFRLNVQNHSIKCVGIFEYLNANEKVLTLQMDCLFDIEPDAFDKLCQNDKIVVKRDFLQYMATICVGAARGEIHARCEAKDSALQSFVLPQINLVKVIETDAIYQMK